MLVWIVMAAMAAAAALSVLVPLYRGRRLALSEGAAEVSIYKDQLGELDRDLGRGLIAPDEAGAARTEIARRLLKADAEGLPAESHRERPRSVVAVAAVVAVPIVALGLYLSLGSPDIPDQPLAARLEGPLEAQDAAALIARVEAHLVADPNDGRGWDVVAPAYLRAGRFEDAARAFANAIRLLGGTAQRETGLGDALIGASDGVVTEAARAAFQRAHDLDPTAAKPRFFLAVALTQEGRRDEAMTAWRALLDSAPGDAPWVPVARAALARLEAGSAVSGPSPADIDAAAGLPPEQRDAMIEAMVGQLAARLNAEPSDADGWARLLRSYMVLGRKADAEAALAKARTALAADAARLAVVEAEARAVGLIP